MTEKQKTDRDNIKKDKAEIECLKLRINKALDWIDKNYYVPWFIKKSNSEELKEILKGLK